MHFAQPIWIVIGLLCCIVLYGIRRSLRKKRTAALYSFVARNLAGKLTANVSETKRQLKFMLILLGIFCCFLALARPQLGHRWIDVKRKGIDILFAVDTSLSMQAKDIRPNRLERSKFAILDFIGRLEGDRVGLIPFAGSAFLICPLTIDYQAFEQSLKAVDTNIIPEPGTNIGKAISSAEAILQNDANHKLLIIITDGENLQGDVLAAAARAAENNMTIYTVGVGTRNGELVPLDSNGERGFIKDEAGNFVVSRLDEKNLRLIAEKTDGLYVPLGNKGQGLETIYQRKLALLPKEELAEKRQKVPIERFPWFLGLAFILLVAEFLLSSRKTTAPSFGLPKRLARKFTSAGLLVLFCSTLSPTGTARASAGEEAYREKNYQSAANYYREALQKNPENAELHYNSGAAAYKENHYEEAISSFTRALQTDNLSLQEKTYYNLGNSHFRKGEEQLQTNSQKTMEHWQEALSAYSSSLQLRPDHQQASYNYDLVEKKLKELQQQEQQKEQKEDEKKSEKDDKQRQNNSGQASDDKKKDGENQEAKQENKSPSSEASPQPASPRNSSQEEDAVKQQNIQGKNGQRKMTQEEARQLLEEMQNEEGTLNFLPKKTQETEDVSRNW